MTVASNKVFKGLGKKAFPYLLILPVIIYYAMFWLRPVFGTLIGRVKCAA